ncbi:hypothetical protein DSLPV1_140 [Dishui lake phycodnavirus 1]|uniref:hypothetical protein n=1 Tax=Dishui lake phycodnavirus 1 TaxID=2079134 RepID=UPI000CD689BB|nr:hypothetical protein C5Y57_gp140 [Dishui lake phycodnavirus 1]AUT19111.1 hypothetical protein DSLPV1_140 [Dishui lake phycodnavirus 1]
MVSKQALMMGGMLAFFLCLISSSFVGTMQNLASLQSDGPAPSGGGSSSGGSGGSGGSGPSASEPPPPVTHVSGQYVRIHRVGGDVINVSEMAVFDENGVLISKGATVTGGTEAHPAGPYANLTNGNLDDFAHNLDTTGEDHITIDLGSAKKIGEVILVNRRDCCQDRIVGKKLQILDTSKNVVKEIAITKAHMVYSWTPTKTEFNTRSLPSGVSTAKGWINKGTRPEGPHNTITGDTIEEGDCFNATRAAGHKIYGYRTASHPNPHTCFYYKDDPGWTSLSSETLNNVESHNIGCTKLSSKIESACSN